MRLPKIGLERIGLRKIGLCRVGSKGASSSLLPAKIVGTAIAREIGATPSAMANGTLTDQKWAKVSVIKGNSVVDGEQILSYQQWGGDIEIKAVGLNQWDEEWEVGRLSQKGGVNETSDKAKRSVNYTRLTKNTNYYCAYSNGTSDAVWLIFYDLNGTPIYHPVGKAQINNLNNVINQSFITPNQDCTVRFYTKNEPDSRVCLHLVQDGLVSQYKPYTSTTTLLPNVSLIKDTDGNQLFPYGLCSAGSVYDEITETMAIKRVGVDMGALSYYELAEPIEVEIDKWKAEYKVEQGGTEQIVSANNTTNLKADIIYGNKV